MRTFILLLLVGAAVPVPAAAQGTAAPGPRPAAVAPTGPLARIGSALIEAVNSGDSATIVRFAAAHLGHDARGRSPATMATMLLRLHRQSDGLRIERSRQAGSSLRLMTQARNGARWLGLELVPSPGDSTRASVTLYPMDDPGIQRPPAPWSTERLDDRALAGLIAAKVREAAATDRFSGVVLVARGDSVLVREAHGMADKARQVPVTMATPFDVASLGKMFTGVAIAQLVAGGRLRLDDTLAHVLPSYPGRDAAARVTIRQLLTHTAGLPEPFESPAFDVGHDYGSHERLLKTFAAAPASSPSGTFAYSNGNYAALAAVVERIGGVRYDEYLARHVWQRVGGRAPTTAPAIGYARFTELDPLGLDSLLPSTVRGRRPCPRVLGFGCGAYSADELFRFARGLQSGALLPRAWADTIVTGRVGAGGPVKYGFGFYEQVLHGVRVVGHPGSNPDTGHDADLRMLWNEGWTVIVLSNYDAPAGMMLELPILDLLAREMAARRGAGGG